MEFYDKREWKYESVNMKDLPKEKTSIQNYYTGKTILITGGTGFLGTLLIEKFLRLCVDVEKIILVVRAKNSKIAAERVKEIFQQEIYYKMRSQNPDYWKKVHIIKGYCERPNCGIEELELSHLLQHVQLIFHLAGSIRYDEHIKTAYRTNVTGTKRLLELAKQMTSLEMFVHVSNVYVQSHLPYVAETIHGDPLIEEHFTKIMEKFDDATLACFTEKLIGDKINTYLLTKNIAENVVSSYSSEIPVAVCRLSLVGPTTENPLTCWTNKMWGVTDLLTAVKNDFLDVLHCDRKGKLEVIPADIAVNSLLTIPRHVIQKKSQDKNFEPVFNYIAKPTVSINWEDAIQSLKYGDQKKQSKYKPSFRPNLTKCLPNWWLNYVLVHVLPIMVLSIISDLTECRDRIMKNYVRWYWDMKRYTFFMTRQLQVTTANTNSMIVSTSDEDKMLFNCDNTVDWENYLYKLSRTAENYIEEFSLEAYKDKKNDNILKIAGRIAMWVFRILMGWYAYRALYALIKVL